MRIHPVIYLEHHIPDTFERKVPLSWILLLSANMKNLGLKRFSNNMLTSVLSDGRASMSKHGNQFTTSWRMPLMSYTSSNKPIECNTERKLHEPFYKLTTLQYLICFYSEILPVF